MIDAYLTRRITTEDCWDIVREVWCELTGTDLGDRKPERIAKEAVMAQFDVGIPEFVEQAGPVDPSIILMRAPGRVPHVGLYMRGRVLQLAGKHVSFLPLDTATVGWPADGVGFYLPKERAHCKS